MESAAALRSLHYSVGAVSNVRSFLEKPGMVSMYNATWPTLNTFHIQGLRIGGMLISSPIKHKGKLISCVKTSETAGTSKCDDGSPRGLLQKDALRGATFPNGFEALVLEVCDETDIAELKLKVGDFEMHLKRNIGIPNAPIPVTFPAPPPTVSAKPTVESGPPALPAPPKPSPEKISPFTQGSLKKPANLRALEASGCKGYVFITSPMVGLFQTSQTVKGKRQPPACKEGDLIKEGQVIGYMVQFENEIPVKSNVAGEVLKVIFNDQEAVGYGDPLVAILPSS